jgi:hypothetical protein
MILDPVANLSMAVDAALEFSNSILCALREDRFALTIMSVLKTRTQTGNLLPL